MEKLQRRSDGVYETPSGLLAISPRVASGKKELADGTMWSWFEFKASHMGEVIRIEWPTGAPVIAIEATAALHMMKNNYAFNIDDVKMQGYNDAVDAYLSAVAAAPAVPEPTPVAPAAPEPAPVPDAPPAVPTVPDAPAADEGGKGAKKGK